MQTLHAQGRCAPCLYYTRKKDGCRKGLDGLDGRDGLDGLDYAVTSFKRLWDDKKRESIWSAEDRKYLLCLGCLMQVLMQNTMIEQSDFMLFPHVHLPLSR